MADSLVLLALGLFATLRERRATIISRKVAKRPGDAKRKVRFLFGLFFQELLNILDDPFGFHEAQVINLTDVSL
jgi:hypothetical protein